jgi:Major capsid protein N-terminus
MSGGVVKLVATGEQDMWLTGKPEISFYRSTYRKYTHYANSVERQIIQGAPSAGGISTIRFEKKGDLLSYVYFTATNSSGSVITNLDWTKVFDKFELLIGGQVIDTQDIEYMTDIEPVTGAQTFSQRLLNLNSGSVNNQKATFLPLKFFFCKDWSVCLPLIALQYHDVEIRITWSTNLSSGSPAYSSLQYQCWSNFVYLDQMERDWFAKSTHDLLVTQVQRAIIPCRKLFPAIYCRFGGCIKLPVQDPD